MDHKFLFIINDTISKDSYLLDFLYIYSSLFIIPLIIRFYNNSIIINLYLISEKDLNLTCFSILISVQA